MKYVLMLLVTGY